MNDNAPQFAPNTPDLLRLTENSRAGAHVATFAAIDRDEQTSANGRIRYYLAGGNATKGPGGKCELHWHDDLRLT